VSASSSPKYELARPSAPQFPTARARPNYRYGVYSALGLRVSKSAVKSNRLPPRHSFEK
jgi:hypothetical protein